MSAILGLNAKTWTMVLPRQQFLAVSILFASTTQANPRCHKLPWVVRRNLTSVFCRYLWHPVVLCDGNLHYN